MEGKIETGSLGLLAMFLGAIIVLVLNLTKPFRGQEIRLVVNGNEIIGKSLSFRKVQELVEVAASSSAKEHTAQPANVANKPSSPSAGRLS